ncbi:YgjV family protein [Floccifex sp.]|uniref:YgjV family protein n=1 Tax=Floccifex sp. TaxID=2815810 RepID=UPI003F0217E3
MVLEIFGYIGSCLVVISMLMSSVIKLRVINTIGSVVSGIYALLCHAYPLALMNASLIVINLYGLYKLLHTKQSYDMIQCLGNDVYIQYLLNYYQRDIKNYFPEFDENNLENKTTYLVSCEGNPAGIFIGYQQDDVFEIILDYSTPKYRDCSVANFIYNQLNYIQTFKFNQKISEDHESYLKKMGFVLSEYGFIKNKDSSM